MSQWDLILSYCFSVLDFYLVLLFWLVFSSFMKVSIFYFFKYIKHGYNKVWSLQDMGLLFIAIVYHFIFWLSILYNSLYAWLFFGCMLFIVCESFRANLRPGKTLSFSKKYLSLLLPETKGHSLRLGTAVGRTIRSLFNIELTCLFTSLSYFNQFLPVITRMLRLLR